MRKMKRLSGIALISILAGCGGDGGFESTPTPSSGGGSSSSSGGESSSSSGGVSSSSSGGVSSPSGGLAPTPVPTPSSGDGVQIEPGTLTAGDYDDLLNPLLYQNYLSEYLQSSLGQDNEIPFANVSQAVTVRVLDENGNAYEAARVQILVEGDPHLQVVTPVTGIIRIFPQLDQLPDEFILRVTDRTGDNTTETSVTLDDASGLEPVVIALPSVNNAASELDLSLVIDTTGSMGDEIRYLQAELAAVYHDVADTFPNLQIRTSLVAYRDEGDAYVVQSFPFTDDLGEFQINLERLEAIGGGDYPEAMDQAMNAAMELEWQDQSAKILLLVADAPPHDEDVSATWTSVDLARRQQVHIVPVAASGVAEKAEFLMRSMAIATNSRYIFLTDDSGVGDSHDEPSVDCYIVTPLNDSLTRVISSLLQGERVEPDSETVIRTEGNYNEGICEPVEEPATDDAQPEDIPVDDEADGESPEAGAES